MSDAVIAVECKGRNAEALEAALRRAAQERGFGILNITDLRRKLEEKGIAFGTMSRVYDICNPQAAAQALGSRPEIAAVLPCRIALVEGEGGMRLVMVRPTALLAHFGTELLPLAREVEAQLEAILRETANA